MFGARIFLATMGVVMIASSLASATATTVDFDAALVTANQDPATLDGNGNANGDANGILDSDELAVVSWILADASRPHHDAVYTAYTHNLAQFDTDMSINPVAIAYKPLLRVAIAGYLTLGDDGGLARGGAIVSQAGVVLDPANYDRTQASVLAFNADPDGDGLTNLQEYEAITGLGGPGSAKRTQYIHDVFTAAPVIVDFDTAMTLGGLKPASEDSNGPIVGGELTGNGILDSDELAVLASVLADNTSPFFPAARAAYVKNLAQMTTDSGAYAGLVATALAGYVTLGDANTVAVVTGLLAKYGLPFTAAGYDLSQSAVFAFNADPDEDQRNNLSEYTGIAGVGGLGSQKRTDYIAAVFTPFADPSCQSCSPTAGLAIVGNDVCLAVPTSTGHTFQWYLNDTILTDGRVFGSTCKWLRIPNVQLADSGTYKCVYYDAAKSAKTYTTILKVASKVPAVGTLALAMLSILLTMAATLVLVRVRHRA